jgi:alkanesulfonate monooxygenase SsuD/methylene tetrahydromethanopterin reductase-like flavin-dependent oxidoreductase (luciferase family)
MGGQTARWSDYVTMAGVAEEIGVDSLWFVDHLLYRGDATESEQQGLWECWSMLTGLAAITRRVELGSLVTPTSFRNPAVFAKTIDAIEEISGGRVILGLGAGWHEDEYRAFGLPYDRRVSRFEEAFTIIRCLLRDGSVDFDGTYYSARDCEICPRGPRPNGPPLMIGSSGKRMLAITLPHVDRWNAWPSSADEVPVQLTQLDEACREVGRDPAEIGRSVSIKVNLTDTRDIPESMGPSTTQPINGSPDEIAAGMRAFAEQGIDHLQVLLTPNTVRSIELFGRVLEAFDG